jgi:hypothetical protein
MHIERQRLDKNVDWEVIRFTQDRKGLWQASESFSLYGGEAG